MADAPALSHSMRHLSIVFWGQEAARLRLILVACRTPLQTGRAPSPPPHCRRAPRLGLVAHAVLGWRTHIRGARRYGAAARPPPRASSRAHRPGARSDRASVAAGADDRARVGQAMTDAALQRLAP